jgi:protein-L-isoaspartate O-methyltransferase
MFAYGLAIFWGALLLFLVQPLIARFILPWFGGGPAVWTTCMLFFQVLLLGGYAYAHLSIRRLRPRTQVTLHLGLLLLALCLLPITPAEHWKPVDAAYPAARILWLLLGCLGLPYLMLSATGPLLQAWFSRAHPGASPYRLYALSNIGSLLALVGYPFLLEPHLTRQQQATAWSIGLAIFAVLAAWCGARAWGDPASSADLPTEPSTPREATPPGRRWFWFLLPACAVVLLLATTNTLCQDIAVIPFLWILPLGLYLLTFIINFDSPRWYRRRVWLPLLATGLAASGWILLGHHQAATSGWPAPLPWLLGLADDVTMYQELGIHLFTLFVCCMACHGEVYRLRPAAEGLTGYYLSLSAGGAGGGLFVAALAPLLFDHHVEFQAALLLTPVLVLGVLAADPGSALHRGRRPWAWGALGTVTLAFAAALWFDLGQTTKGAYSLTRNFYGVLKVVEFGAGDPLNHRLVLQHGGTTHGMQYTEPAYRGLPATYYTATSGVGRLFLADRPGGGRKVAVVGLGTGSLSAWGRPGDTFRFYEINDDIVKLARGTFTFLRDTRAKVEIAMGDARLSLEREPAQGYDIIVLDAFSSDAIPVHLLTDEALATYLRHLAPGGTLAVHISNRSLNLEPVVMLLAARHRLETAIIHDSDEAADAGNPETLGIYSSDWVLLGRDRRVLDRPAIAPASSPAQPIPPRVRLWTDEQSDLLSILITEPGTFLHWLKHL